MRAEGIEDVYELTPIQEGLLFHTLVSPGSGVYLEQVSMAMRGRLDVAAYRRAWQDIVDRHTILRTSFHWDGVAKPLQVVHAQAAFDIEVLDWRGGGEPERERRYAELARADRVQSFDYAHAPLMRGRLIRWDETDWEFFWSFSHLLLDGWSFGLAFAELAEAYRAHVTGEPATLPAARPYRDYLAWWQRQDRSASERYWREYLAGYTLPGMLEAGPAPAGTHGPAEPTHAFLPTPELLAEVAPLTEFSRAHGLTLNTVMQGAWMIILGRYLGRRDVLAGSTGTHRPESLPGAERIMGPMLATTPVRARLADDAELTAWLAELQATMARSREHAHLSLADLRQLTDLPGSQPMFELDLAFENVPVPDLALPDLEITGSAYDGRPHYPITMIMMPGEAMPEPRLVYDQTRFGEDAARRLAGQFGTTLRAMMADPGQRLGDIEITPERERACLAEWGHGAARDVAGTSVLSLVADRVGESPDAVAVTGASGRLSYRELAGAARRVAQVLVEAGVSAGDLAGVAVERDCLLPAALLGIMAAGAAYLPVDTSLPPARMRLILEDSGAAVVLADEASAARLPDGTKVLPLPADLGETAAADSPGPDGSWPVMPEGNQVAYVMYTSGSTGRPKGVAVTHAALANLLLAVTGETGLQRGDVLAAVTTVSFDIAGLEIFGPLITGATTDIVSRTTTIDGAALASHLADGKATALQATPTTWRLLREASWQPPPGFTAVLGGETVPTDLTAWLAGAGARTWHVYGPTETTIWSTIHHVTGTENALPLGYPIANTQLLITDPELRPVPIGAPGELLIGGAGVAAGYWRNDGLTRERFIDHPAAGRVYRTGDIARWHPDGSLEFLGRADHQIKIRGYRVELGDIETTLRTHPAIREAVTTLREDTPGQPRLAAYYTAVNGDGPAPDELRAHCATQLPDYMVPTSYTPLPSLPLTPNGKIDRAHLPAPGHPTRQAEDTPPRTPTEHQLAKLYTDILGLDHIGIHDNFFTLGGHSLLATRLTFALKSTLGVDAPIRLIFDRPTVAELADAISSGAAADQSPEIARRPRVAQRV
jgi:amino acid adenylation domain-containing protein